MEEKKELIVVKQLPVIEEQLRSLSDEIDKKVSRALSLVVSDETVKEVKKVRAELNADFKDLEQKRKSVKEQVMNPYLQFEEIYKKYVTEKFKYADEELKKKISMVETEQLNAKSKEIKDYFEEYKVSKNIDFITFENANINITLSASNKSLKEQAKEFIDKVSDDLALIDSQEHKEEILIEYKKSLNVSLAITTVVNRYKELEELKKKQEVVEQQKQVKETTVAKVEEILSAPVQIETTNQDEILEIAFKVRGSREKLKELVHFLKERGYEYEQQ